ncbi:MAG: hypothetical protein M4579_006504 [Chaenotheca gracillima]|nr:MAG: hypothetical protein M4579_006504 [Chaenotheca gracillima]
MRIGLSLPYGALQRLRRPAAKLDWALLSAQRCSFSSRLVLRRPRTSSPASFRALTTSSPLYKKSKSKHVEEEESVAAPEAQLDPHDLSTLETVISSTLSKLDHELSKLRPGGRVSIEDLEALKVQLVIPKEKVRALETEGKAKGHPKMKETTRLADLAQVVPKGGRGMIIMVGEKEHIKPIQSAISSSSFSLAAATTSPTAVQSLELHYTLPPPTTNARASVLETASNAGEQSSGRIRDARGAQQKRFRGMELGTQGAKVRSDELRKARAKMEDLVKKGEADIKKLVDASRKKLEAG